MHQIPVIEELMNIYGSELLSRLPGGLPPRKTKGVCMPLETFWILCWEQITRKHNTSPRIRFRKMAIILFLSIVIEFLTILEKVSLLKRLLWNRTEQLLSCPVFCS